MAQKRFLIDGGFSVNDDSAITGNLDMTGNIVPTVDSDGTTGYDLGSPTAKWRDLYLSQGSLYVDGTKVLQADGGTILVSADEDQSLTVKTTGTGVLTLQSATTVNFAGNLQMGSGTAISSNDGTVTFSDKVDMDNNQIINVAAPTADGHATNKGYVDQALTNLIGGAPAALDTLNELANALGDDANFASSVTLSLADKADTSYVDAQVAAVVASVTSSDASISTAETDIDNLETRATNIETNLSNTDAVVATNAAQISANATAITTESSARSAADTQLQTNIDAEATARGAADTTLQANIDAEEADRIAGDASTLSSANAYTDTRETAITTAYQAYADQAEADAKAYADTGITTFEASLTHFHSSEQTVTAENSADNVNAGVEFIFTELSGAKFYMVLLNRFALRKSEYSVSGTTVTINPGILATDDEIEVTGLSS